MIAIPNKTNYKPKQSYAYRVVPIGQQGCLTSDELWFFSKASAIVALNRGLCNDNRGSVLQLFIYCRIRKQWIYDGNLAYVYASKDQ